MNILHTSSDATQKDIEVTVTPLELPYYTDRLFDFQGDYGINYSSGRATSWDSLVNSKVLVMSVDCPNYQNVVYGDALNLIPTLRFDRKRDVYTYEYSSAGGNLGASYGSSLPKVFTCAAIFKLNSTGTEYICCPMSLYTPNIAKVAALEVAKTTNMLSISGTDIAAVTRGEWHCVAWCADYVSHVIRCSIDGGDLATVSGAATISAISETVGFIGAYYGGLFASGCRADIAAFIGWKQTVAMTASDLLKISEYLMAKYGLA